MNISILQELKREFVLMYKQFEDSSATCGFREKIKIFSDDLLLTSTFIDQSKINRSDFYELADIFLNYWTVKNRLKTKIRNNQAKTLPDVVPSYSRQRFIDYITIPEVAALIKIIISRVGVEKFITNIKTLNAEHKEKCSSHLYVLISKLWTGLKQRKKEGSFADIAC